MDSRVQMLSVLSMVLFILIQGRGQVQATTVPPTINPNPGNVSMFTPGANPPPSLPNFRPSQVPVAINEDAQFGSFVSPAAGTPSTMFTSPPGFFSTDAPEAAARFPKITRIQGIQPVVSDPDAMVAAMRSEEASTCVNPFPRQFFSLPQRSESVSTGTISAQSFLFGQDFRNICYDRSSKEYRTFDGTCNHPSNLGASFTPVARLLPPEYDDGISLPRTVDYHGQALPSARKVSVRAHPAANEIRDCTVMVMQWGQWLDHDLTGFPVATEFDDSIKCCGANGGCPPFNKDKSCFPIELPPDETNFEGQCMEFVRSIPARDFRGNEIVPREQVNSLTSFVDASQVYGSSIDRAEYLRQRGTSLLRTEREGSFLARSVEEDCIKRRGSNDFCFIAGDIRVNEQPGLAAMHTLWLREHNRIAKLLKKLGCQRGREEIFQISRKIVGALQQVITYNEWLPIILGDTVNRRQLLSKTGRSKYNPALDPRILNVFSTAAMRFGHSLIPSAFSIGSRKVPLRELFNRPAEVLDNFDDLLAGLVGVNAGSNNASTKLQNVDMNFVTEITNFLFEPPGERGRGFDLVALNIQRGRDHGIAPYTKWRAFCGLRPLYNFSDTAALGPNVHDLASIYQSVDDIDLFTGLMYEPVDPDTGGIVGPTLNCLLSIQFFNVKFGDRFFFDNDEGNIKFNDAQLAALRNETLSKVLCRNTYIHSVPQNAFKFASADNPKTKCRKLNKEGLDLTLFL